MLVFQPCESGGSIGCDSTARVRMLAFCGAAALTVLCGFSVLKGKLPTYIVPMLPPLSIVTAAALDAVARAGKRRALLWTGVALTAMSIASLVLLPNKVHFSPGNMLSLTIIGVSCVTTFASFTALILFKRPVVALWHLAASWSCISAILVPFLFLVFYNHHQRGYANLLEQAQKSGLQVVEVVNESPSAPFYLHKHVPSIQNYFDLAYLLAHWPGDKMVLCSEKFEDMPRQAPVYQLIDKQQHFCLYRISDPDHKLLKGYYTKLEAARVAHARDPREPDPAEIITTPSRSIFQ